MGMSIEEVIKELNWEIKVHSRVIKEEANNVDVESDWMKHWESVIEAFNIAINTMRKYQKIQEVMDSRPDDDAKSNSKALGEIEVIMYGDNN